MAVRTTERRVMPTTIPLLLGAAMVIALATPAGASGVTAQTSDVMGQGMPGPVYAASGATLQRSANGINAKLTMPTPEPGTYSYPPGNVFQPSGASPGHPEAYSFWVFVFNYPDLCTGTCDMDDIGTATAAKGGVYNAGGHIVGGATLSLSGRVSRGAPSFSGSMLLEPLTAVVHLAVAPHGVLDPALLPTQITRPVGTPAHWWGAVFE